MILAKSYCSLIIIYGTNKKLIIICNIIIKIYF